jgi:DNA-binding response OmpR family regulator
VEKRVLLVEDDEAIAEVVTLILHESGYAVDRVATVADARVHVHDAPVPALVLLDLTLPDASGISFLRTCRASGPLATVPIVVLTARSLPEFDDDLAPDAVLTKPFDIDGLCAVVDRLTSGPGVPSVVAASARLGSDDDW